MESLGQVAGSQAQEPVGMSAEGHCCTGSCSPYINIGALKSEMGFCSNKYAGIARHVVIDSADLCSTISASSLQCRSFRGYHIL